MALQPVHDTAPTVLDQPDVDQQFIAAIDMMKLAKRAKVRLRVIVQLYCFGEKQYYRNWKGLVWRLDLEPSVVSGSAFRAALSTFFLAIGTAGPARVAETLRVMMEEK